MKILDVYIKKDRPLAEKSIRQKIANAPDMDLISSSEILGYASLLVDCKDEAVSTKFSQEHAGLERVYFDEYPPEIQDAINADKEARKLSQLASEAVDLVNQAGLTQ